MGRPPSLQTGLRSAAQATSYDTPVLNTALMIDGWTPVIDEEQHRAENGKISLLSGRNFKWTTKGPRSAWAYDVLTQEGVPICQLLCRARIFMIKEYSYIFCAGAVYTVDAEGKLLRIFAFPWGSDRKGDAFHLLQRYKWSEAYVGQRYYFSHPMAGIIEFDAVSNTWSQFIPKHAHLRGPIFGVANCNDRLLILLEDTIMWSKMSDGHALSDKFEGGSGFQNLDVAGQGMPFWVEQSRRGFYVRTSNGSILALQSEKPVVWEHTQETRGVAPLNATCVCEVEQFLHVYLTKRGFYITSADRFRITNDEEWQPAFGRFLVENILPFCDLNSIGLEYNFSAGELYVSIGETGYGFLRNVTFVYQFTLDKWGELNVPYVAIGEGNFRQFGRKDQLSTGILLASGKIARFGDLETDIQAPGRVYPASEISLGLFKQNDQRYADRLTQLTDMKLNFAHVVGEAPAVFLHSVLDANEFAQESEVTFREKHGKIWYYNCYNICLWAKVAIKTGLGCQAFALNTVEVTAHISGRL